MLSFLSRVWEVLTRRIDRMLFGCAIAIVGVGIVTLFSASDQSVQRVTSQLLSFGFAIALMWLFANIPPQTLARAAVPLYAIAVLMLSRQPIRLLSATSNGLKFSKTTNYRSWSEQQWTRTTICVWRLRASTRRVQMLVSPDPISFPSLMLAPI